jgi:hypothetical protein
MAVSEIPCSLDKIPCSRNESKSSDWITHAIRSGRVSFPLPRIPPETTVEINHLYDSRPCGPALACPLARQLDQRFLARRRPLRLEALGREWGLRAGDRGRNLEEFLPRSRNLICGTCVGIGRQGLQIERNIFDLVIIDEAARCNPGELAVGMRSARRILLVGGQNSVARRIAASPPARFARDWVMKRA